MIGYLANRWQIRNKFEETPTGWVYRQWRHSAPVPVSAEEREFLIKRFAHHGWWNVPIIFAAIVVLGLLMFGLTFLMPSLDDEAFFTFASYAFSIPLLGYVFWRRYRAATFPMRYLNDRIPVGPGSTWAQAHRDRIARTSWAGMLASFVFYGALLWLSFPRDWPVAWEHALFFGFVLLMMPMVVWNISIKSGWGKSRA